ncbi:MAG: hypothetical protein N3E37_03540 [Candidatus Micrarchaeota archaeon]|nr:hypothetical protein [Candidatus Micrarchaeota archaeon]
MSSINHLSLPELQITNDEDVEILKLFGIAKNRKLDLFYANYVIEAELIANRLSHRTVNQIAEFTKKNNHLLLMELKDPYFLFKYLLDIGRLSKYDLANNVFYVMRKGRHLEEEPFQYLMQIISSNERIETINQLLKNAKLLRKELVLVFKTGEMTEYSKDYFLNNFKFLSIKESIFD